MNVNSLSGSRSETILDAISTAVEAGDDVGDVADLPDDPRQGMSFSDTDFT